MTDILFEEGSLCLEAETVRVAGRSLVLDAPGNRRTDAPSTERRALVHDYNDGLTLNWHNDYPGGVTIQGFVQAPGLIELQDLREELLILHSAITSLRATKPILDLRFAGGVVCDSGGVPVSQQTISTRSIATPTAHDSRWGQVFEAAHFPNREGIQLTLPEGVPAVRVFGVEALIRPSEECPIPGVRMNIVESQRFPVSLFLEGTEFGLQLRGSVATPSGWMDIHLTGIAVTPDRFHHVGLVHTGRIVAVYLNDSIRVAGMGAPASFGDAQLWIGSWVDGRRHLFEGEIAGVKLWNVVPSGLLQPG